MKLALRVLAAVVTAPVWLLVGLIMLPIVVIGTLALLVINGIEFAFGGEWEMEWPWQ